MQHGERRNGEWERSEYERDKRYGRRQPGSAWRRPDEIWERERQGAGGYGYGGASWNQEWDRDDWERRSGRRSPSYGYRPSRSYDWWGERSDIPAPEYGARSRYERESDQERRSYPSGPYTGRGPKGYQRSDERIREDICDRLTEHPAIDASEIEVEVKNGEVTLTGAVDSRAVKHLAEVMVETVAGVKDVHNQLRVSQGQQTARTQTT